MSREAVLVIGDILKHELVLDNGQVMLTNERYKIPDTNGIFIALSIISGKAIANNTYPVPVVDAGLNEKQDTVMLYEIQIDILSFDGSARTEQVHCYQALASSYAESAMEANNIQVARMPSGFTDASSLEESKLLNRYTMNIGVTALISRTKAVEYYDEFPTPEVTANE